MNPKQIQDSIKHSLGILMKVMKQLPGDKRPMIAMRINDVMKKSMGDMNPNQDKLRQLQKQLQFNLNFVKLSHPKLDFTAATQQQMKQTGKPQPQPQPQSASSHKTPQQQNQPPKINADQQKQSIHKFKVFSQSTQLQIQRLAGPDTYDQQLELQKSVREQVSFSNWFDGNADPQQLKRHKQLLQRQHFQGEMWKDKPKPTPIAAQYLKQTLAENKEREERGQHVPRQKLEIKDMRPSDIDQGEQHWEKLKR